MNILDWRKALNIQIGVFCHHDLERKMWNKKIQKVFVVGGKPMIESLVENVVTAKYFMQESKYAVVGTLRQIRKISNAAEVF